MIVAVVVVLALLLLLGIWAVAVYNGLVAARNRYRNAFSQIDVQLKRRYDLVPNLVETVKGYLAHEQKTLAAVIEARNGAVAAARAAAADPGDPAKVAALAGADAALGGAVGRIFALAEAYPDLKGNQPLLALMEELSSTENKVAFARQAYNDAIMAYNTSRETFPSSLVAGGFAPAQPWEVEDQAERQAPRVSFAS